MRRRSFLGTAAAVLLAPLAWAGRKAKGKDAPVPLKELVATWHLYYVMDHEGTRWTLADYRADYSAQLILNTFMVWKDNGSMVRAIRDPQHGHALAGFVAVDKQQQQKISYRRITPWRRRS